ncbi:MAG: Mov34/MPN/PAD-1 family protein [Clostridiales bacterium]|nr:Mov34/MPN/PAD-1 family protein [Clostridiales bacterium]
MSKKCDTVIISDKAYNAIIRESFAKHPVETGGILLGYILDNGLWVVMEMIPPGINGVFQTAYFEYDQEFVNYLGTSVANQYKEPLQVLGLWHRHPGSMDYFSSTDDVTNSDFASKNPYGVISGLVNIDPAFRLTMYHLDHNDGVRPRNIAYSTVDVEVGDDLIPEKFFALRYVDAERSDLNPTPTHTNTQNDQTPTVPKSPRNGSGEPDEDSYESNGENNSGKEDKDKQQTGIIQPSKHSCRRKWLIVTIAVGVFVMGFVSGVICTYLFRPERIEYMVLDISTKELPGNSQNKPDSIESIITTTQTDSITNYDSSNGDD